MPRPACSGRDAIAKEVLNDDWVSHPTWASEDGGFIAHKKNLHEEALYRCEEERYEFDLNIESNKSVIATLDAVAYHITQMSPEEARRYRLPPSLIPEGSSVIYQRVIRKIYDRERGQEVIDSLLNHPAVAVNLVLKRLQQKDEEWRKDQVCSFSLACA
jgi:paired amphipathic helix protein Sin3a